jgi:hypothetical protein
MEEETINNELNIPHQMALPMKTIRINEFKNKYYNVSTVKHNSLIYLLY